MYRLPARTMGLLAGLSLGSTADADVLFVKPTPTGAGDCSSWAHACALTDAIDSAESDDEVWVMAGIYGPIGLKDGVRIIGGFAGNETNASQSNHLANVTALDGGGTHTVVIGVNNPPSTLLRGFHIRNGLAPLYDGGGGMYLEDSSPTVVQCVFEDNQSDFVGGAVYIPYTFPLTFPRPRFVNCVFRNNGRGTSLLDVEPFGGGAVYASQGSLTFINCVFHHNRAGDGGAFLIGNFALATFVNCTFAYNTAFHRGGAIVDEEGRIGLYNSILWGNTRMRDPDGPDPQPAVPVPDQIYHASAAYNCDIQGGWDNGSNNIDADPLFQDVAGGNFNLQPGSPCQDTGSNAYLPADDADLDWDGDTLETLPKDAALRARTIGIAVDIGAYEVPICGDGECEGDETSCNCTEDCGPAPMSEEPTLTCHDAKDNDCDTLTDCDDPDCDLEPLCMGIIPTVSQWGLVILTLLLLTGAKVYFGNQASSRLRL